MSTARTHHFLDDTDYGVTIITRLTEKGEYIAYLDHPPGNVFLRGHGHTRLAAIANLKEILETQPDCL